jgi:nucleoside-diphosphate-sugar epimerase
MTVDPRMQVFLTGGTGFIGRSLLAHFEQDDYAVTLLQRNVVAPASDDMRRLSWSLEEPEFEPVEDVATYAGSTLVHLAAVAHRRGRGYAAKDVFNTLNAESTVRLARSAACAGIRHFVFMSSIGVLGGDSGDGVFDESDPPAPISPYAQSKWLAEQGLRELAANTDMQVTVLRPPVVYGPGAPGNFGSLLRAIRRGLPLPFDSICNSRQMLALDNLVDAVSLIVKARGSGYRVFHLADHESVSTPELCRCMAGIMQRPSRVFRFPPAVLHAILRAAGRESLAQGLLGNLRISTATIEAALQWKPRVTLQQGLERALLDNDDH